MTIQRSPEPVEWKEPMFAVSIPLSTIAPDEGPETNRYVRADQYARLLAENRRLRVALHDAIRRGLGVVPDSAAEFYDPAMADEAERRRSQAPTQGAGDG